MFIGSGHCGNCKYCFFIRYGCPDIEVIESYNREYKKRLDEAGQEGELPEDLAIEVII